MITTFVIGGTPRSGKSFVQKLLLKNHSIPGITTDLLREGLMYGVPDFGILPYETQTDYQKSQVLWPFFKGILIARKDFKSPLVIEGTNFLPKYLSEFKDADYIKTCFLGYTNVDIDKKFKEVRAYSSEDDDWTSEISDVELKSLIKEFIEISRYFKSECEKFDIAYFDTSSNFYAVIEQVEKFLLRRYQK